MKKKIAFQYLAILALVVTGLNLKSQCSGTPAANTVVTSVTVCPGSTVNLNLLNSYSGTGYTYQWWVSSLSTVGPWTVIPGATLPSYTTAPQTQTNNLYYTVQITCTNTASSITAVPATVHVSSTTTSTPPLF